MADSEPFQVTLAVTQSKTILFIEDEEELLHSISQLFRDQGYHVISVPRAEDALNQMIDHHPDLILADIKLPGIDGFDFFTQVLAKNEWKDIPVIFLTAFNNVQAMMHAKKLGVKEYITKPFDFEYLIARVRSLIVP
ncbi:MAG: response regulator transcription factor [Ignavibacteriae bacterium]|nr:response regulator transcription factor [Ignavibacteria bacterium]MBI3364745.1 response regulator transcription factor [Ignavibacteriota bacterium]